MVILDKKTHTVRQDLYEFIESVCCDIDNRKHRWHCNNEICSAKTVLGRCS